MSTRELRFQLTEDHIKLLRRAYVSWDDGEFGAPAIDCKRPYGNSFVEGDVAEILGWTVNEEDGLNGEQRAAAEKIHRQTQAALQIVLVTGAMIAGEYVRTDPYHWRSWVRVDASPTLSRHLAALESLATRQGESAQEVRAEERGRKSDHPCEKCGAMEVYVRDGYGDTTTDARITCHACKHSYMVDGIDA